jgi:putative ABC transport system permease protein
LEVDRLAERIERAIPEIDAKSMAQFNLKVGDIMGKLDLFLVMAVGLAFLVGGVGIANTMLMSATERIAEFGVMRTTGWTRRNVLSLVTIESVLLGFLSGAIGSVVAVVAVMVVNSLVHEIQLDLNWALLLGANATAILIAAISGLYPAWRASRMTPMDAIRSTGL